jgi:hypothetical protein
VPSSALLVDATGLSIATVNADNHVLLKPVSIGRDLGAVVEVASGLAPNDRVIENPPDGIRNGAAISVADSTPVGALAGSSKHPNQAKHDNEKS